jgi:hypothetical protein
VESSRALLQEIAHDLERAEDVDDLRAIALKMSVVLERLIDVTNLNTIEERVDRCPHPSTITLQGREAVR